MAHLSSVCPKPYLPSTVYLIRTKVKTSRLKRDSAVHLGVAILAGAAPRAVRYCAIAATAKNNPRKATSQTLPVLFLPRSKAGNAIFIKCADHADWLERGFRNSAPIACDNSKP